MPVLEIMNGEDIGKRFEWTSDRIRIGRLAANDFAINNASVSGEHCLIERTAEGWRVKDLGSTNGTRLNDSQTPITMSLLHRNDILMLGDVALSVRGDDIPEATKAFTESVDNIPRTTIIMRPQAGATKISQIEGFSQKKDSKGVLNMMIVVSIILIVILSALLLAKIYL